MRAIWDGTVVAESDNTVVVEGNHYFPRDSVRDELLRPSDHRTVCPWKGVAGYWSLADGNEVNPDAAWTYERPSILARRIKGRVAFGAGVEVVDAGGGDD